jgi:SAM-dependent methyltransferase
MDRTNNPRFSRSETFTEATRSETCPLCGSSNVKVDFDFNGFEITRCGGCGFVYTNPIPSEAELQRYYSTYAGESDEAYVPYHSLTRRLKYAAFARFIKRYFPAGKKIRLLEIGCSQGDLLNAVRDDPQFEAMGIDYAVNSVNYARSIGLNAEVTDLFAKQFLDESFDLVVSIHVVEHVRQPREWLTEIHRVLARGGVVFLVTPNVAHFKARRGGENWKYWGPPGHLWYFAPKTMSLLGKQIGFETIFSSGLHLRAHLRYAGRKPS